MLVLMTYFFALLLNRNALSEGQVPAAAGLWLVHGVFLLVAVAYLRRLGRPMRA